VSGCGVLSDPECEALQWPGLTIRAGGCRRAGLPRSSELLAAQASEPSISGAVAYPGIREQVAHRDLLDMSVLYPAAAIASDAMPWTPVDGSFTKAEALATARGRDSHPVRRVASTALQCAMGRERRAVSLSECIRKCTRYPGGDSGRQYARHARPRQAAAGADADNRWCSFRTRPPPTGDVSRLTRPRCVRHSCSRPAAHHGWRSDLGRRRPAAGARPFAGSEMSVPGLLVGRDSWERATTVVNYRRASRGEAIAAVVNDFARHQHRCRGLSRAPSCGW